MLHQLGKHSFHAAVPVFWAGWNLGSRSLATQQSLCPDVACEGVASSSSLSDPKRRPSKKGRVPDRKGSFQTRHLPVPTPSPSDTDVQEQPVEKEAKEGDPGTRGGTSSPYLE